MKLWTITNKEQGQLIYGSPKYPMWVSDEPDVFAFEKEYSEEEYCVIRKQADAWGIEILDDEDDDHGYSQTYSKSEKSLSHIRDEMILVKDGSFFGIIKDMYRNQYFYKKVYVSIDTAKKNHGLWSYHNGRSSDNGSHSEDTVYYLRRVK